MVAVNLLSLYTCFLPVQDPAMRANPQPQPCSLVAVGAATGHCSFQYHPVLYGFQPRIELN